MLTPLPHAEDLKATFAYVSQVLSCEHIDSKKFRAIVPIDHGQEVIPLSVDGWILDNVQTVEDFLLAEYRRDGGA